MAIGNGCNGALTASTLAFVLMLRSMRSTGARLATSGTDNDRGDNLPLSFRSSSLLRHATYLLYCYPQILTPRRRVSSKACTFKRLWPADAVFMRTH